MSTETERPDHAVRDVEHCWIPMPDGVRLAARIWFPSGGPGRHPALFEYIPYRKRDLVRARDERNHPIFAAHGYVCLRVDMRGSGDSEGVMPDMYAAEELSDARHVIEWIAAQPWCTGRVGMFGTSWGGTASLQAAVDAPAPLKAVLANCATVDRFEDDIHWMGGCLLTDSIEWGATLPAILALPPDRATIGPDWRDMWRRRLETLSFSLENWIRHATRGAYWRRGSVRFDAEQLSCPVLSIGGWSDRYSNSVMSIVQARPDLCWGVVGPWGHHYPDHGAPGPALDFQAVALRWWDHWLKQGAPGDLDWPRLQLWRREFDPPQDRLERRNGAWLAFPQVEPANTAAFGVDANGRLAACAERADADLGAALRVPFDLAHGECAGDTGYFGRSGGLPLDQNPDDQRALCFETGSLEQSLDIAGAAELSLALVRALKDAQLAVRLCDVAPDGRSTLITRTVRNLALDDMLDSDAAWDADAPRRFTLRLPTTCYRLRPGHRLRIALGASYWPLIWPPLRDPMLRIVLTDTRLSLPTLGNGHETPGPAASLASPEQPISWRIVERGDLERRPMRTSGARMTGGWRQAPTAIEYGSIQTVLRSETTMDYSLHMTDPEVAECAARQIYSIQRADGAVEVRSSALVRSHGDQLRLELSLAASFEGEGVFDTALTIDI